MPIGATIGAAGLGAVGSIAGGMIQANAADKAAQVQQDQYNQTRSDLMPYQTAGQGATNMLTAALPSLTAPITMDQATLEQTPGYSFNLQQGLKATQNSAAARGLGTSGAAVKGAATYATGLADSTYQNQFNNANTNNTNAYNRLMGVSSLGENAAAQTGSAGTAAAQGVASSTTNAGTAVAAGITGAGNALTNGANNIGGYNAYQNMLLSGMYAPQQASYGYGAPSY